MNVDPQATYFLDTNILVYAYDRSAGQKHSLAVRLVEECWENENGCLSIQVLQEFFVTVTRKIATPLDPQTARQIVADLAHPFGAAALEELQVIGVIDDAAGIGILVIDANGDGEGVWLLLMFHRRILAYFARVVCNGLFPCRLWRFPGHRKSHSGTSGARQSSAHNAAFGRQEAYWQVKAATATSKT